MGRARVLGFVVALLLVAAAVPIAFGGVFLTPSSSRADVRGVQAARSQPTGVVPRRLLVRFRPGVPDDVRLRLEQRLGAREIDRIPQLGILVIEVPQGEGGSVRHGLERSGLVRYAEPDGVQRAMGTIPNDEWWPNEWSPVTTHAPTAWDTTTGASSVTVAVLDTGVDFSQPDLQGAFVPGRDIVNNDADPSDDNGHGTYVAGIAGARSNNSIGVASYCWTCSIMPVKVLGSNGSGSTSDVAAGITWATDHGARVINMSLGSQSSSSTMANAVTYARDHGVVVVAAAGNYGTSTPVYPAASPGVIGVAATDSTDHLYSWSSFGSWVAVSAPGINLTTGRNSWYGNFAGTSSASPVVAGIAGLVLSANPGATPAAVEQAIENSAVPIGSVVQYGRVDAGGAVPASSSSTSSTSPLPSPSPSPSPTSSPSPSPSPSTSDTPAPSPSLTTVTFTGTLSKGHPTRAFALLTGGGDVTAVLTFTRASSLALDVLLPDGSDAGSAQGSAPVSLTVIVDPGTSQIVVSGSTRASFTLTVTYTTA